MGKTLGFENDLPYLDVRAAERPGLVIESRPPLVRIALGEATLAWFAPDRHWQYVAWLASPPPHSLDVIPPIRTSELGSVSWPAYFARALVASVRAPVLSGRWRLAELGDRTPHDAETTALDPALPFTENLRMRKQLRAVGHRVLRYSRNGWLPLRAPSAVDASRVKAWRKHAREGALPPLLLQWIDLLDGYLILDGHDRLLASLLEQRRPRAVALFPERDEPWASPEERQETEAIYQRIFARDERLSKNTALRMNDRLLESWGRQRHNCATPARYTPDLAERFAREYPSLDHLDPRLKDAFLGARPPGSFMRRPGR
jgi:hypothetical protein